MTFSKSGLTVGEMSAPEIVIRIRLKIYEMPGLGALLRVVMRRLCAVRSEGVPPACAQNRVIRLRFQRSEIGRTLLVKTFLHDFKCLKTHWYYLKKSESV